MTSLPSSSGKPRIGPGAREGGDGSPVRRLAAIVAFMVTVGAGATIAYMAAGWSFGDAVYMVLLTVYSVGYGEVRPINTPYLHVVTMVTIVLGCTGMIAVTGSLVQLLTFVQFQRLLGGDRVKTDIDKLRDHVIICGFGRVGVRLAEDLSVGGARFVILDRGEAAIAEARELGYLAWQGDASDEAALKAVGVERARVLATVLPGDALNVFITLSARSLNPTLQIIARGEEPSTEKKLIQAGADQVVLPTYIGAERMAELALFPETRRFVSGSERMRAFDKVLKDLGLEVEVALAAQGTAAVGQTVREMETLARGAFFIVQIHRADGEAITRPPGDLRIAAGDRLMVVGRSGGAINAILGAPA